jgi:hypothetical protein
MTSLRVIAAVFVSLVVCSACTLRREGPAGAPAPTKIPTRAFLVTDQAPEDGLGAYGFVVFTRRPRPEERARYVHICESYLRTLEPSTSYPGAPRKSLMVTHWLLTDAADAQNPKCDALVDHYDFVRATPIASSANILGSPGPVLVAWATSYKNDLPTSTGLILDLSRFDDADFDRALTIWKEKIVDDPSTWNDGGWKLVKVREAFRNLIQQYGEQIVIVLKSLNPAQQEK